MLLKMTMTALLAGAVFHSAAADDLDMSPALKPGGFNGQILATERLPVNGIAAVQVDTMDQLAFISDNGRFVWVGAVYDTWSRKKLTSLDQVRSSARTIDFSRLNLDLNDLDPLTYGHGPKRVIVWVDPNCEECARLYQQMPALAEQYTFKLLVVPLLGKDSQPPARLLSCATDTGAAVSALMAHNYSSLTERPSCDLAPVQRRIVTSRIIGMRGVPLIIAPNGISHPGTPSDLKSWLAEQSK